MSYKLGQAQIPALAPTLIARFRRSVWLSNDSMAVKAGALRADQRWNRIMKTKE